ncbi:DUF3626 domain-containing protein [Kitasatospora sp. YST-16]|uniref:DUF3626 domain-containing protein n=1 Tax=Kitasatospora sp. YST-16 TaxID=2998080 RepID=UPI002284F78F|nr:DUF3626 domain-containing protein [Kitasatospora sp. YST-16]WAL75242.1 DUF3626 domain-containing protein [Kitasatospora sp. YST-16]WNW41299.1 DUF3626 domain-containing protein [Streptomyces sp. Li-HN-5-13]
MADQGRLRAMEQPSEARAALSHVAARSSGDPLPAGLDVTLNFHPDRTGPDGTPILAAMARDGAYRSQFSTGTSNGGLTAHPGGDRWRWESRIFGGAYDGAPAERRPVYGALNYRRSPYGGAPRFGSAHFRLMPGTLHRATFCYPDSVFEPEDFGTADAMPLLAVAEADEQDALDDCIEAHLHGPVRFDAHVAALVLDPCYRGTEVETAARALPCPVEWHPGHRLPAADLPRHADYRGPHVTALAAAIARDGVLDPAAIGAAARTGRHDPQHLKQVWHCLARFGRPAGS